MHHAAASLGYGSVSCACMCNTQWNSLIALHDDCTPMCDWLVGENKKMTKMCKTLGQTFDHTDMGEKLALCTTKPILCRKRYIQA